MKPRWHSHNRSEAAEMHRWVNMQLDNLAGQELGNSADASEFFAGDGPALDAFAHGDVEPLRKRYPHLAHAFNLPKLKPGQKRKKRKPLDPVAAAIADLPRIKKIWREHYNLKHRLPSDPSAVEIAARRWNVTVDQIESRLKKVQRRKSRP